MLFISRPLLKLLKQFHSDEQNGSRFKNRKPRGLNFGLSFHLHPYFVYASSDGSGKSVQCVPEPLLLAGVVSTKIWCTGPNHEYCM